jgi:hypothetical protein
MTENGTCTHNPGEAAREESRLVIDAAILRMARAAGTPVHQRPVCPGVASTFRYADPGAGMRYARILADAARRAEHQYIQHGREEGMTWHQIGEALNLADRAQERGAPVAEVAFEYAARAEHAEVWGPSPSAGGANRAGSTSATAARITATPAAAPGWPLLSPRGRPPGPSWTRRPDRCAPMTTGTAARSASPRPAPAW